MLTVVMFIDVIRPVNGAVMQRQRIGRRLQRSQRFIPADMQRLLRGFQLDVLELGFVRHETSIFCGGANVWHFVATNDGTPKINVFAIATSDKVDETDDDGDDIEKA